MLKLFICLLDSLSLPEMRALRMCSHWPLKACRWLHKS